MGKAAMPAENGMAKKVKTRKPETSKFTGIFIPVEILDQRKISLIEKMIVADIGYLKDYRHSNSFIAKRYGVSRRTIVNSLTRLRTKKMIYDTGKDKDHRCLKLNGELSPIFDKQTEPTTTKFQKPTPEQVTEYAASIDFELDGQVFVDHYESKGWLIGKTKMRDWKAAVRTWKARREDDSKKTIGSNEPYIR